MAVFLLSFFKALSYTGARNLLLQEGYVEETKSEARDASCGRTFLYPYVLYDGQKRTLDCIYYMEYCRWVRDEEYLDGRMTWEAVRSEWTRTGG